MPKGVGDGPREFLKLDEWVLLVCGDEGTQGLVDGLVIGSDVSDVEPVEDVGGVSEMLVDR